MRLTFSIFMAAFIALPALAKEVKPTSAKKPAATKAVSVKKPVKPAVAKKVTKPSKRVAKAAKVKVRPRGKFKVNFLSYAQLARLPKAKRLKYIKDLRELMITIERYQRRYETASNPNAEAFRKKVAFILQQMAFIPEVQAESAAVRLQRELAEHYRELSAARPACTEADGCTCPSGTRFDVFAGTCFLENLSGSTDFYVTGSDPCPANYQEIPHPDAAGAPSSLSRMKACVPDASGGAFSILSRERRMNLLRGKFYAGNEWANMPYSQKVLAATNTGISNDPLVPQSNGTTDAPAGTPTTPVAGVIQVEAPAGSATTPASTPVANSQHSLPAADLSLGASPIAGLEMTPHIDSLMPTETATDTAPADVAEVPAEITPASCQPQTLACTDIVKNDAEREAAISAYRNAASGDDCIYAGFLARYAGGKKVPGGCNADAGKYKYTLRKSNIPVCPDTSEVMCNPVMFCAAASDGTPMVFCVKPPEANDKNRQITRACNDEFARIIRNEPKAGSADVIPLLPGEKGFTECDPWNQTVDPLIQEDWNDMIADTRRLIDNLCTNDNRNFQVLFCRECEVIMERARAMNAAAGHADVNCGPAPASTTPAATEVVAPVQPNTAPATAIQEGGDLE